MATTAVNNDLLQKIGLAQKPPAAAAKKDLGQSDFLQLMTAQMKNQDPMQPMENGQFLQQMASFSQVKGLQDLQASLSTLSTSLYSNQALQAATLVGKDVLLPGSKGVYIDPKNPLQGAADLTTGADQVNVTIQDSAGQTLSQFALGAQPAGRVNFVWDGKTDKGTVVKPGVYGVKVTASVAGKATAADTLVQANVSSISFGKSQSELKVNLLGLGDANFSDVKEIR